MFVPTDYPEVLLGLGSPDDAAVYRLDAERALIVTADFFTPIVDDAYDFGAIAAANALSDVYAMGGMPLLAINLVAFPPDLPDVLAEVLRGGAEVVKEAGVALAGGHTIQDKEPKYGLAVIGLAHPDRVLTRAGARPGDALVLTKPLGTGVIVTAFKRGQAEPAHLAGAVRWMRTLNRIASRIAVEVGLQAATDVTGFGLLGHAREMAMASGVGMEIRMRDVPLMEVAQECACKWLFPRGSFCNRDFYGRHVRFADGIGEEMRMLLFDAQTSGGLLLAVPPEKLHGLLDRLRAEGESGWVIGQVVTEPGIGVISE
jgi:selenide,water dikinase